MLSAFIFLPLQNTFLVKLKLCMHYTTTNNPPRSGHGNHHPIFFLYGSEYSRKSQVSGIPQYWCLLCLPYYHLTWCPEMGIFFLFQAECFTVRIHHICLSIRLSLSLDIRHWGRSLAEADALESAQKMRSRSSGRCQGEGSLRRRVACAVGARRTASFGRAYRQPECWEYVNIRTWS